jgi:hypothetical protein
MTALFIYRKVQPINDTGQTQYQNNNLHVIANTHISHSESPTWYVGEKCKQQKMDVPARTLEKSMKLKETGRGA